MMTPTRSVALVATWHLFVGTSLARSRRAEVKVSAKARRVKARNPETCLFVLQQRRSQELDMLEFRKGWSLANCVSESHEVSDEPLSEAVVGEVWCVAVSDGPCDLHQVSSQG